MRTDYHSLKPAFEIFGRARAVVRNPGRLLKAIGMVCIGLSARMAAAQGYTEGHGDIGVAYEEGEGFFLHYHLGPAAVLGGSEVGNEPVGGEFEPADVVTIVAGGLSASAPDLPAFNTSAGTSAGSTLWILPATQAAGYPFLGIATEELEAGDWNGNIVFTLQSVVSPSGNGHFSMWDNGAFGELNFHFSSANPSGTVNGNNTLSVPTGTHAHFNWAFTEPGTWEVTLNVTGTHAEDGVQSDTETFTFQVVPEPGSLLLCGLTVGMLGLRRRRRG